MLGFVMIGVTAFGLMIGTLTLSQVAQRRQMAASARRTRQIMALPRPVLGYVQLEQSNEIELELQAARAEVDPLLVQLDAALDLELARFRLAMSAPMRTARRWHYWSTTGDDPIRCPHVDCDAHAALAQWRIDTPTGEMPVYPLSQGMLPYALGLIPPPVGAADGIFRNVKVS